ncbi:nucleosome assembly protein 1-like 1-B isoform X2 [Chrysoperla carnea]|uniref:nucleosome assembly protein 1-like 1-B isoform X2 n=1 Tax=Chrysoperla carnea TaxID=189513 RepID=UPI001D07F8C4|nr:nucleosome assembly protein 1-like 1-B isoform X2 [Chrysoperla carnea]
MSNDAERFGDGISEGDSGEEEDVGDEIAARMLRCPDVLAAIQGRLHSEMLAALPQSVKRRIKALKKIQLESTKLEARFYEEVHALECKYHNLYSPHYEKRETIVTGKYEPTEDECDWPSDDDEESKPKITEIDEKKEDSTETKKLDDNVKGVPEFWLTIFKNVGMLAEMVHEHDEPILKHLTEIKVNFLNDPMGFNLEFYFSPNEYFTNSVLTKEYLLKCVPEQDDPFSFEGPEIYKCKGCTIDWQKGKNVTVKTITKKQKHKSRGSVRTVTKTVQNDSFFNFFSPPVLSEDPKAEMDDETRAVLTTDFEIGHYIRERIVPRAVLYYTGEGLDDEDDDYDDEEEEDEEEDDEEEAINISDEEEDK